MSHACLFLNGHIVFEYLPAYSKRSEHSSLNQWDLAVNRHAGHDGEMSAGKGRVPRPARALPRAKEDIQGLEHYQCFHWQLYTSDTSLPNQISSSFSNMVTRQSFF